MPTPSKPKPVRLWVVIDENEQPFKYSFGATEQEAISRFECCGPIPHLFSECKRDGYRCIPGTWTRE